ncbi:alpha/beta-hydrolase [Russula compacta]|nr:alpha/beta-hydrolase [Russula compacta]
MWTSFQSVISIAAGLLGNFQQHFNISHTAVTRLTDSQFAAFTPYTEFARAAYCDPSTVAGWKCGAACDALPGFLPTLTGGDGDGTQYFYVGYWPTQSAVVVGHQGTNPHEILSVLTDLGFNLVAPDPTLFPGVPTDVEVHLGFSLEHQKTASQILAEVQRLLVQYSSTNVVLVGHSLGGALAELDSLFLKLNLPEGTTIRGVTYGTPRAGNEAWSTFFDSQIPDFTRINNKRDPVTIIPGRLLGFMHPSREIHIQPDGSVVVCPGADDDVDPECSYTMVPSVGEGDVDDHDGPYHGILIGNAQCTP